MMKKNNVVKCMLALLMVGTLAGCSAKEKPKEKAEDNKQEEKVADKKSEETVLYVTRHGKTIFNTMKKVQGWSDTPLTEEGIEVAEALGKGIKDVDFTAAYSSDFGRARETARIVLDTKGQKDLVLHERKGLRELNFGKFEGDLDEDMWGQAAKTLGYENEEEVKSHLKELGLEKITDAMAENDETGAFEKFADVRVRMQKELTDIAKETEKNGGGNVLVVSHGMAISAMLSDWTDQDVNRPLPNASISKLIYKDDAFVVETVGDMSYVEKGQK